MTPVAISVATVDTTDDDLDRDASKVRRSFGTSCECCKFNEAINLTNVNTNQTSAAPPGASGQAGFWVNKVDRWIGQLTERAQFKLARGGIQ